MQRSFSLWTKLTDSKPKIQQPRYRRACCGELIQIDGCDHHWFENRAPACTALVYVDDATSRLMPLRFVKSESTFTYFEATRGYLEKHGKPLALYSDKASVFRINNKNATGWRRLYSVWPCEVVMSAWTKPSAACITDRTGAESPSGRMLLLVLLKVLY